MSTLLDYTYGFYVCSPNKSKAKLFLILSLINNLGILGVFKYYNFFIEQFQAGFNYFGVHSNVQLLNIVLPVGISFYTFHGMSYVFDIYNGKQKPISNFVTYATFVSFFPLLVAGPIERAHHLLPQIQKKRIFNYSQSVEGIRLILWGLFKKLFVADNLSIIADNAFNHYKQFNSITLVVGAIAFSFQIYSDFSGYSDIAIGSAKLLGFELLSNFKFPYFSKNIVEFWRTWHISLTSWFKDYLYIPLGGSKGTLIKTIRNTIIVFLVSGFWHGASWNFIVWGMIHAFAFIVILVIRNICSVKGENIVQQETSLFEKSIYMIITFIFVTVTWIFFRAQTIEVACGYIYKIITNAIEQPNQLILIQQGKMALVYITPLLLGDFYFRKNERQLQVPRYRYAFYFALTIIIIYQLLMQNENTHFIYFQF